MLALRYGVLAAVGSIVACAQRPSLAANPRAVMIAPFVARSPRNGETPPRNTCWVSGEFAGDAVLRDGELSLVIPSAWIAVTRDNDKQWDDLHLAVEVSAHPFTGPAYAPVGASVPLVLRPTVDSAGPQLTTWQLHDTLRLFVPWKQSLDPRWLIFAVNYQTLSYKGERASCGGRLGTDTLRFSAR